MDLELLLQFLQAAGTSTGAGRTLNNLDNPLLGLLTGGFDPMTMSPGAGGDWSRYAGNPEYPELQKIISEIEAGRDQYQISSAVDALTAGGGTLDGFQPQDFKNLALNLQKEYSGGDNADWFRAAGLSSPLQQYTAETVPMDEASMRRARLASAGLEAAQRRATRGKGPEVYQEDAVKSLVEKVNKEKARAGGSTGYQLSRFASWLEKNAGKVTPKQVQDELGKYADKVLPGEKEKFMRAVKNFRQETKWIQPKQTSGDLYSQGQAKLWELMAGAEQAGRAQGFAQQGITPLKSDLSKRLAALAALGGK